MFDRPRQLVLVAAIQALALAGCAPSRSPPPDRDGLAATVQGAIGAYRPTVLRLSIDLEYTPCQQGLAAQEASCSELSSGDFEKLSRELSRIVRIARETPGPEASHTEALARLLVPRERYAEEALEILESLHREEPDNPEILSDLAVALGHKGLAGEARRLVRALDLARRAARQRPSWPTARFNVAVLEKALYLPWAAHTAWEELLQLDDSSGWSEEARERLRLLPELAPSTPFVQRLAENSDSDVAQLVRTFPQEASEYFLETLLPDWAKAHLESSESAEFESQRLIGFAEALRDIQKDHLGSDAIAVHQKLIIHDSAVAQRIIAAIVAFGEGRQSLRSLDLESAESHLQDALSELDRAEHPLRLWCRIWLSLIHIYRGDHEAAATQLRAIEASVAKPERYPALMGRVHWHAGLSLTRQGRDATSLARFRQALPLFESLAFRESSGRVHHMIADDLVKLGQTATAWGHRLEALRLLAELPRTVALHNALLAMAETATLEEFTEVAEVALDQAVMLAEIRQRAISTAEAHRWRSRLHADLGRFEAAGFDLLAASQQVEAVQNSALKQRFLADVEFDRAKLEALQDPTAVLPTLDNSIDFYRQRQLHGAVIDVHVVRARVLRATQRSSEAFVDLEAAIELLIEKNWTLADLPSRLTHNDVVQSLFEETVALQADDLQDPIAALAVAECGRLAPYAGVLSRFSKPATPFETCAKIDEALRARLNATPRDTTILAYMLLEDRVLIWRLADADIQQYTSKFSASNVEKLTASFIEAMRAGHGDDITKIGSELYQRLLQPALTPDDIHRRLVIIPDRFLSGIPFTALSDPVTGRFLIQDHLLEFATTVLAPLSEVTASTSQRSPRALLVADPAFDRKALSWLDRLPGSQRSVNAIAPLYPESLVLADISAHRTAILEALPDAEIFHYAGHAVANRQDPLRSYLVLAAGTGSEDEQLLKAEDLLALNLGKMRLVVLSGCETAGVGSRRGAGLAGLAMPFLLHGTEAVIASQWPVRDDSTAVLMEALHRRLTAATEPATALRQAQLELLESDDPKLSAPASWAPFVTIRGFQDPA